MQAKYGMFSVKYKMCLDLAYWAVWPQLGRKAEWVRGWRDGITVKVKGSPIASRVLAPQEIKFHGCKGKFMWNWEFFGFCKWTGH